MSNLTDRLGGAQASLAFKAPVRCATTANITLSGFQTVDDVTLADGDENLRVLVKDQTDTITNGIYTAKSGAWTRVRDFDGNNDFVKGTRIYVTQGSVNGDTGWVVSSADPPVVGTSAITFSAPSDEAATSAAAAASSATAAASSATAAASSATTAASSATTAASSATTASSSATAAASSATAAASSATAAASSETNAATSATNAASSASAASTSATNAASSATSAAASATEAIAGSGWRNTFSTTTTMADPGAGAVRFNNATFASITAIAVSYQSAETGNPDVSADLLTRDDSTNTAKGTLRYRLGTNPATFAEFTVTGLTDNSTWIEYAVTPVGTGTVFSNGATIVDNFSRAGDKGADGAGTGDVVGPASSVDGEIALFDLTTGKLLKRASTTGVLKATSGVMAAATAGTDYLAPPSGTALLKANSGGALANATAGSDYLAPPSGTALLKANSGGALANATPGTDYYAPGSDIDAADGGTIGQQTIWIPASAMIERVTTAPATYNTVEIATSLIALGTMDFATDADDHAGFAIQMPKGWDEGTIVAQFVWSTTGAQSSGLDGVAWFIRAGAYASSDVLTTALGTAVGVTQDHSATANDIMITSETSAITVAGTPSAEEWVYFEIYRDVSDAADDLDIDARLHGVKIHYTIDSGNDS